MLYTRSERKPTWSDYEGCEEKTFLAYPEEVEVNKHLLVQNASWFDRKYIKS